eukprot:jgi/Hompol1/2487/HPOL_006013-RA
MAFDASGRRLITGGRDGTIKIWNFNNGQLLQELVKKDKTEVTGLAYIDMRDSTYFVATGWNRKITMFTDDPDSLTLYPTFTWPDPHIAGSTNGWHEDDILSMVFCPPNILATSSYDGEIVICNLHSGHILHRLRPIDRDDQSHKLRSKSIDKVLFLQERSSNRESASLVSTGTDGLVRFWNIFFGILMCEIDGTQGRKEGIFTMVTNASNTLLFTGDALGYVCVFDIHDTAISGDSPATMPLVVSFRAHLRSVTSMDIVEGPDVLVTCSADCTIRMFTMKGEYVGIFGQTNLWELGQQNTYMFPQKPADVAGAEMADEAMLEDGQGMAQSKRVRSRLGKKHASADDSSDSDEDIVDSIAAPVVSIGVSIAPPQGFVLPALAPKAPAVTAPATGLTVASATQKSPSQSLNSSNGLQKGSLRGADTSDIASIPSAFRSSQMLAAGASLNLPISTLNRTSLPMSTNPAYAQQLLSAYGTTDLSAILTPKKPALTRVKTADLLSKGYSSWYAKSLYAKENFQNHVKRKSHLLKPLNIGLGAGMRVYHRLQPYDLVEVNGHGTTSKQDGGGAAAATTVPATVTTAAVTPMTVKLPLIQAQPPTNDR